MVMIYMVQPLDAPSRIAVETKKDAEETAKKLGVDHYFRVDLAPLSTRKIMCALYNHNHYQFKHAETKFPVKLHE